MRLILWGVSAGLLLLSLAILQWDFTLDDAYISFRYAENMATGHGPVFNIGQRIEGFSNPLWVGILSLLIRIGIDPITAAKTIGLLCMASVLFIMIHVGVRFMSLPAHLAGASAVLLALTSGVAYYSISGMETASVAFLILAMVAAACHKRFVLAALLTSLIIWSRPEGILYAIPFWLSLPAGFYRNKRLHLTALTPLAALAFLLVTRHIVFGTWLPNTFYAKVDAPAEHIVNFIDSLRAFSFYTFYRATVGRSIQILAFLGAVLFVRRSNSAIWAPIPAAALFVFLSRGDWMDYWRFYLPVCSLLILLAFKGIEGFLSSCSDPCRRRLAASVVGVLWMFAGVQTLTDIKAMQVGSTINAAMHSRVHKEIGRYLMTSHPGISEPVVTNEIGAIGYFSGRPVIDMLGLIDDQIPRLISMPTLQPYSDHIMNQNPRFVLLNNRDNPTAAGMHPLHHALYRSMQATGQFELIREFPLNSFKSILVFEDIRFRANSTFSTN